MQRSLRLYMEKNVIFEFMINSQMTRRTKRGIVEAVNAEVHSKEAKTKVEKDTKARARKEINTEPIEPAVRNRACNNNK